MNIFLSLVSCIAMQVDLPKVNTPEIIREFIYLEAPFPQCHATTIAEAPKGLVTAWFGGTREKAPDVGIWVSRSDSGKWTTPIEVANGIQADGKRHPCWNPVLFQPKTGPLMLFYKVGPSPSTWWGELRTSVDSGKTWSTAIKLPDGILGPIKNKPVQLPDGFILSPTSTEENKVFGLWKVHFELSKDLGKTWSKIEPAPVAPEKSIQAIQPSILFHGNNKLQALGRTKGGKIFETWSDDLGKSWSALSYTNLPNPNSGTDAVTLKNGSHLLVYNHTDKGRSPLNLAISKDGKTWEAAMVLEKDPGEYSYPAIIQTADGMVHITYTWKRIKVRHLMIDPAKLSGKPMVGGEWPR